MMEQFSLRKTVHKIRDMLVIHIQASSRSSSTLGRQLCYQSRDALQRNLLIRADVYFAINTESIQVTIYIYAILDRTLKYTLTFLQESLQTLTSL